MAAAEGCDEKDCPAKALGRPSLRMGELFREDLGLEVVEGDEDDGSRDAECCLRNVGVDLDDVDGTVFWRVALGLLRWTVAVDEAEDISELSDEGPGGRSDGGSECPFMVGRESCGLVGIVYGVVKSGDAPASVSSAIGASKGCRHESRCPVVLKRLYP